MLHAVERNYCRADYETGICTSRYIRMTVQGADKKPVIIIVIGIIINITIIIIIIMISSSSSSSTVIIINMTVIDIPGLLSPRPRAGEPGTGSARS